MPLQHARVHRKRDAGIPGLKAGAFMALCSLKPAEDGGLHSKLPMEPALLGGLEPTRVCSCPGLKAGVKRRRAESEAFRRHASRGQRCPAKGDPEEGWREE